MLKSIKPPNAIKLALLSFISVCIATIHAAETDVRKHMLELADESKDTRKAAIEALTKSGDMRLIPFFKDFSDSKIYLWKGKLVQCANADGKADILDALTREPLEGKPKASPAIAAEWKQLAPVGRGETNRIESARSVLGLYAPEPLVRRESAVSCAGNEVESSLTTLIELLKTEQNAGVRFSFEESVARLQLMSANGKNFTQVHIDAIRKLGELSSSRGLSKIKELLAANTDGKMDPAAVQALNIAREKIEGWQATAQAMKHVFNGISTGSILILMALGLSIIFGLMGVINMAHGELMMIGAYATFVTQEIFKSYFPPSMFDWYFPVAMPVAFLSAAIVGYLIERLLVRHLYGRPLDSLLATWGVSIILIQIVRRIWGDNNGVNSPSWLQGNVEIMQDVALPFNRLFIIGFCGLCIILMFYLINKTKLGLLLRATTQNRGMAASLGVSTRAIDGYTFALGAGLAGMAGCALTQVGGVTPDMGQNYIVDSFMTVVTGGVGKLAGAIWAGFGLGMINKLLEAVFAAVWGKILILLFVVVFIQWRPSGLFPAKGRNADA